MIYVNMLFFLPLTLVLFTTKSIPFIIPFLYFGVYRVYKKANAT